MFNILKDIKISTKLTTITVIAIVLFAFLTWWAIYSLGLNKAGLDHITESIRRTSVATAAQIGTKEVGVTARDVFIADTKENTVKYAEKTAYYLTFVDDKLLSFRTMQHDPKLIKSIDSIRDLWTKYSDLTKVSMNAALNAISQKVTFFTLGDPLTQAVSNLVQVIEANSGYNTSNAKLINQLESALNLRRIAIWRYLATQDYSQVTEFQKQIDVFNVIIDKLNHSNLDLSSKDQLATIKQASDEYNTVGNELVKLTEIANSVYFNQATQIRSKAGDLLDKLVTDIITEENILINDITAISISTSLWMVIVAIIIAILLLIATTLISRSITQPIVKLSALMEKLAEGRLDVTIDDTERGDEIGLMARSITRMIGSLGQLLNELKSLIACTRAGELVARKNKTQLKGEYADVVVEANELLDILTKPLIEVVEVVQHLANGKLKQRMQGTYSGELNVLKSNVNRGLDDLLQLLKTCSAVGRVRAHIVKLCKN